MVVSAMYHFCESLDMVIILELVVIKMISLIKFYMVIYILIVHH